MKINRISVFALTFAIFCIASVASAVADSPQWSANTTLVASPATYGYTQNMGFQVVFKDPSGETHNITDVYLEINHTRTATNYTAINNTSGEYWYNITTIGAGTWAFKWYGNDTANGWNSTDQWIYTVNKVAPNVKDYTRNDSYIHINQSLQIVVNMSGGATVKIQLTKPSATENYTITGNWSGASSNYTFDIAKSQLGDGQDNITQWLNITVYVGGINYTEVSNGTDNQFNFSYASTSAITVADTPDPVYDGSELTITSNYTRTESIDNLIQGNCTVLIYDTTYCLTYTSGQQKVTFGANPSNPGNYFNYTMTCSNSSYQTQTASGLVFIGVGAGSDGGGGGGRVTATTTTTTTKPTICGNGICEMGESFWNCMKDCPLFTEGGSVGGITTTTIPGETATPIGMPWTTIAIIGAVLYLLFRKK